MEMNWEEPITHRREKPKMSLPDNVLSALKENPERWALLADNITYAAASGRAHKYRLLYPGYEFKSPKGDRIGTGKLYGRYVGGK